MNRNTEVIRVYNVKKLNKSVFHKYILLFHVTYPNLTINISYIYIEPQLIILIISTILTTNKWSNLVEK